MHGKIISEKIMSDLFLFWKQNCDFASNIFAVVSFVKITHPVFFLQTMPTLTMLTKQLTSHSRWLVSGDDNH